MSEIKCIRADFNRIIDAAEICIESYVWLREPTLDHGCTGFDETELRTMEKQMERVVTWSRHALQKLPSVTIDDHNTEHVTTITWQMKYVLEFAERNLDCYDSHRYDDYVITDADHDEMEKRTLKILSLGRSSRYHFGLMFPEPE